MKFGARILKVGGAVIGFLIDGILGYFNAEEWGVSKLAGVIGGVLGGGEGGIMNMFLNAGKWAIAGATIGSVFPVVGTLIGGVAGALTEEALTKQTGMEYVVKTGNGSLISVVQSDDVPFEIKQHVIVVYGTRSRIIDDPDR